MAGSERRRKRRSNKNQNLIVALRHPLRRKILRRMADGRKASPSELAKETGDSLSSVAYHVRVLAECSALKPVSKSQVRGATKHFYRWSVKADWVKSMLEEDEEESS